MSLTATCTSICPATARSSVSAGCALSPGLAGQRDKRSLDRLNQPGKEADGHHGADSPDRSAPANSPDRAAELDHAAEPGSAAETTAPSRAAEAARLPARGADGTRQSPWPGPGHDRGLGRPGR